MECSTECETAGALGKLVAFLASILQRAEILKAEEFADLLAVFAATVAEANAREGVVLAGWAMIIKQGISSERLHADDEAPPSWS
jgi:hypothetical protein